MPRRAKGEDGLTEQQRQFRDTYLQTRNARQADKHAYSAQCMLDASIRKEAYKLLNNPNIAPTLAAKQETAQLKHDITIALLTEMLQDAFNMAKTQKQSQAMTSAAMALGKLHGLIVDKRKDVTPRRSIAEIDARIRAIVDASRSERDGLDPDDRRVTIPGYGTA